ncbi:MAG: hypothetical protein LC658_01495, partial [Bacteroidales bacterium]|nr:hypothetical protein [Bacteroidales bacterium]
MKNLRFSLFAALVISVTLFSGCSDDPEEEVSQYAGSYVITKATLSSAINLAINGSPLPLTVPAGSDITPLIQQSLLSALTPCTPDKSMIELKEDYTMLMKCEGTTTEINAGTWEEVSATVLKLSMNSTAIPSSPLGIVLTVNNVNLENKKLTGDTSVPMPKETLATVVTTLTNGLASLDMNATPVVLPVNFS